MVGDAKQTVQFTRFGIVKRGATFQPTATVLPLMGADMLFSISYRVRMDNGDYEAVVFDRPPQTCMNKGRAIPYKKLVSSSRNPHG